jgi:small conductance mechanosensitive channel
MINYSRDEKLLFNSKLPDSLQKELASLATKTIIIIVVSWLTLYFFEIFAAPILGLKHPHIQLAGSVITITISLVTILATRRILHKFSSKLHPQLSAGFSFFIILFIALIASISILYQWDVNPQEILVGGGVIAIILGIGVSTIVGNIFSGGLMLTTFPAKIGDSVFITNDNVRGKIEEITMLYTKVITEQGTEYVVPNSAIIQGNVRMIKEVPLEQHLPFAEGDNIELTNLSEKYSGTVIKITSNFSTILSNDKKKETIFSNQMILGGTLIITKERT